MERNVELNKQSSYVVKWEQKNRKGSQLFCPSCSGTSKEKSSKRTEREEDSLPFISSPSISRSLPFRKKFLRKIQSSRHCKWMGRKEEGREEMMWRKSEKITEGRDEKLSSSERERKKEGGRKKMEK